MGAALPAQRVCRWCSRPPAADARTWGKTQPVGCLTPLPYLPCRGLGSVRCRYLRGPGAPLGSPLVYVAAVRRSGRVIVAATLVDTSTNSSAVGSSGGVEALLVAELEQHPELEVGHLPNGLRFVVLPNRAPPARFEAHLEIHAGSVDEGEQEQGIAHLVEHVTFLGSKKREGLLGTGARSNAYTDFHHTVFHVHSPERNANTGQPMLWQVRRAL